VPVYEYACTECGERLEVRQSFTDDPLTECPVCSGRLRKVLSPVGVVFKGSGFYRTDSRKAESGSGDKSDTSGTTEKGGDKKSSDGSKEASSTPKSDSGSGSSKGPSSGSDGTSSGGSSPKATATTGS
jgi:putative FmdB family regulatory protein